MDINNTSFRGGFLFNPQRPKNWLKLRAALPNDRVVVYDIYKKGDKIIAIKDCYDIMLADYIKKNKLKFKYYPNINLKSRLNQYNVEAAREIIKSQDECITTASALLKYIQNVRKQFVMPLNYHWKDGDHIPKTFKFLGLQQEEYNVITKNGITEIRDKKIKDKNKNLVAIISPNNHEGMNYVYLPADEKYKKSSRRIVLDSQGKVVHEYPLEDLKTFRRLFDKAVKYDNSKKRPKNPNEVRPLNC